MEIVFENEFFWNIWKAYTCVLTEIERGDQVEVGNTEGGKPGVSAREYTVDKELDKFQGSSGCANIARIENSIATNDDTSSIGVRFLGLELTYWFGVGDLFCMFSSNFFKSDDKESVGASNGLVSASVVISN